MAASSATISKQEYLQRYMSSEDVSAKKKTKKIRKGKDVPIKSDFRKSKIVDDDIDLRALAASREQEEHDLDFGDEAPQIAAFVDERPSEVVAMEAYERTNRWRRLGADDHDDQEKGTPQPSDDRDLSPARSSKRLRHDSDSMSDGPAMGILSHSPDPVSMSSRTRPTEHCDRRSPTANKKPDRHSKSRRQAKDFFDEGKESDHRPTTSGRGVSDQSPPRRNRNSHSDQSPVRSNNNSRKSPSRSRHDSDNSPPRKKRVNSESDQSPARRGRHDSDQSPPRRKATSSQPIARIKIEKEDLSPPRRQMGKDSSHGGKEKSSRWSSPSREGVRSSRRSYSPPQSHCRTTKTSLPTQTLDGKLAGLQNVATLKSENNAAKEREKRMFEQLGDDYLGRNAQTIVRDRASGRQRDLEAENRVKAKEEAVKAAREAKYKEWSKGLKQQEIQEQRVAEVVHEMSKPLARYDDDADLERDLRDQERTGDPMLEYMRKKKAAEKRAQAGANPVKELPKYRGPAPPPNRYNIGPGYRWDGVDRSNGFEKQRVARQANKMAVEEDAYKWSVENM